MTQVHQIHRRLLAARALAAISCVCITACVEFAAAPTARLPAAERVELPGRGQVHVVDLNPGGPAPVVLVHGWGASIHSYRPVLAALARDHRVIALDLPGFGRSDHREGDYSPSALADAIAAVLDAKGVRKAAVVGHSWGASVALAFALRHPERLERLALVSGWIYDDQLLPLMRWARVPGLGEALFALFYREALGERMNLEFQDPSLVTEAMVEGVERNMAVPGTVATALAAARGMRELGVQEAEYPRVEADTLLVWGREDRVSRVGFGERLARELPHARLVVVPRCGHIPMIECRGETLAALRDFLGGGD